MADKAECPACESYTSDNLRARDNGEPCPFCGLPADAAQEIERAVERGANKNLAKHAATAERRAADAEREVLRLRVLLDRARRVLAETEQP